MKRFWTPLIICSLASLLYVYGFTVRVMPSAMTTDLMTSLNIHAFGLGWLTSFFFWGYAPMQIPVGMLYDKFDARKLLSIAIALCAVATILFGISDNYALAMATRLIMGAMAAFGFVGALIVGATWFDSKYFSTYTGFVQILGTCGAIIGQGPVAGLTHIFGWHETAIGVGVIGLICSLVVLYYVRPGPNKTLIKEHHEFEKQKIDFSKVFKNPQNWWAAFYGFTTWTPIAVFGSLWGVPFLHEKFVIHKVAAAFLVSIAWIGVAVGGPIFGWMSIRTNLRRLPMIFSSALGLIVSIWLIYLNIHINIMTYVLLFLFGLSASAQVTSFGLISDINDKKILGTASGFTNMAVVAGGLLLIPLAGAIIQHLWNGTYENGSPAYTLHEYQVALLLIPIVFLLGLIVSLFFIKETYCEYKPFA